VALFEEKSALRHLLELSCDAVRSCPLRRVRSHAAKIHSRQILKGLVIGKHLFSGLGNEPPPHRRYLLVIVNEFEVWIP